MAREKSLGPEMDRILQVRMSEDAHKSLKAAATGVRLENKSALVRAFADAVKRKDIKEIRNFLFMDDDK